LRLQHPPPTELYPLSLHDALPICRARSGLPPPPGTQQHPVIVVPPLTLGRTNYPVTQAIPLKVEPANRHRAIGNDFWVLGDSSRSEEHTSELQSRENLVCRLLLEK